MKRKLIITNIPAFYKINLFNEVNKDVHLTVVFTDANEADRNNDFIKGDMEFEHYFLEGSFIAKFVQLIRILNKRSIGELILGHWDSLLLILLAFISPKKKNSFIVESSYFESTTGGWKGCVKKAFISRISKVYVSGKSQKMILDNLDYNGVIVVTKGVGVFNYIKQPSFERREVVKNFLYVGRFVDVKNLKFLISVFKKLPHLNLYLAGFGEQEEELKSMAGGNVEFLGAVENRKLPAIYQEMDVFVLPSKIEPWGLVVEEALNNGLPVLLSDRVGCTEEIIDDSNGVIFHYNSEEDFIKAINRITDVDFYNSLRRNISKMDFEKIEKEQIACYVK